MENNTVEKKPKSKNKVSTTAPIRVRVETRKRVLQEVAKANKKDFGKRVRVEDVIALAMSLLEPSHIRTLQDSSLTNADRLEKQHREYVAKNGPTSKDEFLGILMRGEVTKPSQTDAKSQSANSVLNT